MPTRYSLCTKAVPKLNKKGEHVQFVPSERGRITYYYFVKFSNGDCGKYGSFDNPQTKFKEGCMCSYKTEIKEGRYGPETKILSASPVKSLLPEGQAKIKEKQLKIDRMAKEDAITFKVAKATMRSAQRAYDALGREMTDRATLNCLVVKLSKWVLLNGYDEQKVANRLFVLEEAIVFANWHKEGYDSSDAIIELADGLISEFREIVKEIGKVK
jgi:hypothetical protein